MQDSGLHAPLGAGALAVVVDMQNLFDTHADWGGPGVRRVLPKVLQLCRHQPRACLFTRFIPPETLAEASGAWRRYYARWPGVTRALDHPDSIELVPELAALAGSGSVIDKPTYSAFQAGAFRDALKARSADCLVFAGVETDCCVLASVLDAVDEGYRVVIATDAVASADDRAHRAILECVLPRLDAQVELTSTRTIIESWADRS